MQIWNKGWLEMADKRDEIYDFFKGMLMIGVVLGHVLSALQGGEGKTYWIHEFVRTYDMPMFAFISGFFLKRSCAKRSALQNCLNKVCTILFPALIWGEIYSLLGGRFIPSLGPWFLYSMFASSIIVIVIDLIKNELLKGLCFFGVVCVFHTLIIDPVNIGFLLAPTILGYYFENIKKAYETHITVKRQMFVKVFMIFLYLCGLSLWKLDYNVWNLGCNLMRNGEYLQNSLGMLLRFSIGILGSLLMKDLFELIFNGLNTNIRNLYKPVKDRIVLWGKSTLELYVLHGWFVSVAGTRIINILVSKLGYNPFTTNERFLVFVIAPLITAFTLYSMHFLSRIIKKIPYLGNHAFSLEVLKKN